MRVAVVGTVVASLLVSGGCQMNERMTGTAFGGAGGLALGGLIGDSVGGALVGGLAGAVAGYLIGDYLADQRERCCRPQQQSPPCGCPAPQPSPCGCAPTYASGSVSDAGTPARRQALAAYLRGKQARTAPEAREAYVEALRLAPTLPDAWNALGMNSWFAGDAADAERCFHEALRLDPTYDPAIRNLEYAESATASGSHGG
jgi:hypothetical protein